MNTTAAASTPEYPNLLYHSASSEHTMAAIGLILPILCLFALMAWYFFLGYQAAKPNKAQFSLIQRALNAYPAPSDPHMLKVHARLMHQYNKPPRP